jgi:hypothetical protein
MLVFFFYIPIAHFSMTYKNTHPISAMADTTEPKVLKSWPAQVDTCADMTVT